MNVIFVGDGISAGITCFFAQQDVPVQGCAGIRSSFLYRHGV